jgi:hypothetical protein
VDEFRGRIEILMDDIEISLGIDLLRSWAIRNRTWISQAERFLQSRAALRC